MLAMSILNYFAYGSNMSMRRLSRRLDWLQCLGRATLAGHELRFHKVGADGSAKCNAYRVGGDALLHGVLYEIEVAGRVVLDRIEGVGKGYEVAMVEVCDSDGVQREALTYIATHIDDSLQPFDWYLHHVVTGAIELELPKTHLAALKEIVSQPDLDRERAARALAIYT